MTAPNFVIVGVPRAGTTSLAHYLRQHPDVYVAPRKETTFWLFEGNAPRFSGPGDDIFGRHVVTDRAEYEALFANVRGETAIGESSVYYFHQRTALERIAHELPGVKVIAVLRDPVERAYSAYTLLVRDGREQTRDFAAAVELEDKRLAAGWEWAWGYRAASHYAEGVRDLQELFGDRALLLRQDALDADAGAVCSEIFSFLGVEPTFGADVSARLNPGGSTRSPGVQRLVTGAGPVRRLAAAVVPARLKSQAWHAIVRGNTRSIPMTSDDRRALDGVFADDLHALASLTGWDLSTWGAPAAGPASTERQPS